MIDKKRVAAVATLERLGYTYSLPGGWSPPANAGTSTCTSECDLIHGLLMRRADALAGCAEGAPEDAELKNSFV